MIQIRRKCPRDIRRLRPRPPPDESRPRRNPSTAGSVHGAGGARRSFGRSRRCGGVEAVRGSPSSPGPTTPSPRSASIRSRRTSRAGRPVGSDPARWRDCWAPPPPSRSRPAPPINHDNWSHKNSFRSWTKVTKDGLIAGTEAQSSISESNPETPPKRCPPL